jgi:hypothetical protein
MGAAGTGASLRDVSVVADRHSKGGSEKARPRVR